MIDLREYRKMRYMGDCKCGKCQLVPLQVIDEAILQLDRLRDLVKTLIENEPDDPIADNGATVLDLWRDRAKRVLGASGPSDQPPSYKLPGHDETMDALASLTISSEQRGGA